MFLANVWGVVLLAGSMLPTISEKDYTPPIDVDIYAMSVDVINEKIYYWYDNDNVSRKTIFPSPIDYDLVHEYELPYDDLFELLGTTYSNQSHNVYIDYDVNFLTTNRRINFGHVYLYSQHEEDMEDPVYWQEATIVNANNVVSNRGYQGSVYLGDWDMGTINYSYSSYCLGWYCENDTTTTKYANVELSLPYLLRVDTNMTEELERSMLTLQNKYYTENYNNYFKEQTGLLREDLDYYMDKYSEAQMTIDNLRSELENGVENVFDWLKNVFNAFASFLNMEIAPNITIGMLLGIPLIGFALFFILKLTLS